MFLLFKFPFLFFSCCCYGRNWTHLIPLIQYISHKYCVPRVPHLNFGTWIHIDFVSQNLEEVAADRVDSAYVTVVGIKLKDFCLLLYHWTSLMDPINPLLIFIDWFIFCLLQWQRCHHHHHHYYYQCFHILQVCGAHAF